MVNTIFITGTGTDVGKTVTAAVLTEALEADYWKPVQAGFDAGTDSIFVQKIISNKQTTIHPETYKLKLPASPHIAAREEGTTIDLSKIEKDYFKIINNQILTHRSSLTTRHLIIEGAGGLMVPLNENEFVPDLIKKLNAKVILVSRNYLGSINHSLLTAQVCKAHDIDVLGWIFNDHYMNYENEIVQWSGYKKIASLPFTNNVTADFVKEQATILKSNLIF
ncbi:dethiobiotin synthase [Parafilimonas terrae]|uniref:ATP-dependent dethiobiotin synthetase BioD n=1 Tax=Parafilimonas terrae TaxID=1465490 RepID=A0A1I5RGQ1_9BACT|nr:dethiobiotin synthase [Parafilimonas terrae]SFP57754.1 dethiobiotin synthetase [Parafilimonas terrae]